MAITDTVTPRRPEQRQSAPTAEKTLALGERMTPMPAPTSVGKTPRVAQPNGLPGGLNAPTAVPGGSTVTSTAVPTNPVPASPALLPLPVQGLGPGAAGTPTNPANPLTQQTLSRAPTADRFQLAQDRFQQFTEQTSPAYQAALRDATRMGAAAGGLGSGQLRTSIGDLAAQRDLNLRTNERGFLTDALEGTIADSFGDVGIAQQQQGFQNQQQQQAFENELRRIGFTEDMINSAFGRGLATWNAGQAGGTGSGTGLAVGGNTQAGGDAALDALMGLIRNQGAAGGGGGGTVPTPTSPATGPFVPQVPSWQLPPLPFPGGG